MEKLQSIMFLINIVMCIVCGIIMCISIIGQLVEPDVQFFNAFLASLLAGGYTTLNAISIYDNI